MAGWRSMSSSVEMSLIFGTCGLAGGCKGPGGAGLQLGCCIAMQHGGPNAVRPARNGMRRPDFGDQQTYGHTVNRFSIFSIARNAMSYHENWQKQWRSPAPKREYDAIIVGGGGHGLATAYYLAKEHGMRNIAVVERGWLGGGNTARPTPPSCVPTMWGTTRTHLYEKALKLWEGLSQELNYNTMFSQRGVMNVSATRLARTCATSTGASMRTGSMVSTVSCSAPSRSRRRCRS